MRSVVRATATTFRITMCPKRSRQSDDGDSDRGSGSSGIFWLHQELDGLASNALATFYFDSGTYVTLNNVDVGDMYVDGVVVGGPTAGQTASLDPNSIEWFSFT